MLNASQIVTLIPDNGSLVLCFTRTKDGQLTVVVDPRYPKSDSKKENETLKEALSPKTVTGAPEMLNQDFMAYLTKSVTSANTLKEQIENIDKETQATIDKAKAEAFKKVSDASKNKAKSTTASKQVTKSPSSTTATQAVLGEEGKDEGDDTGTETTAETEKEAPKPEIKTPALSLF